MHRSNTFPRMRYLSYSLIAIYASFVLLVAGSAVRFAAAGDTNLDYLRRWYAALGARGRVADLPPDDGPAAPPPADEEGPAAPKPSSRLPRSWQDGLAAFAPPAVPAEPPEEPSTGGGVSTGSGSGDAFPPQVQPPEVRPQDPVPPNGQAPSSTPSSSPRGRGRR